MTTIDPLARAAVTPPEAWTRRLLEAMLLPVDIAWLAAFRVFFGLTMCVSLLRFIGYGWVDEFFVAPRFHFKYWGFGWVVPLGAAEMHVLFWTLAFSALAVAAGFGFRLFAVILFVGLTYLQLVDVATYLNHYYLASLLALLLACSPAHCAFGVDEWLGAVEAKSAVARGWVYLLRFQVGLVYTCAGLAKATPDWLRYAQPLRIWLGSRVGMPLLGKLFQSEAAAHLMSWGGFLFDATIAIWLVGRRTRPFAFAAVIVFHLLTRLLFPIGMFPFIMVVSALVFFSPSWPRRIAARLWEASPPRHSGRFAIGLPLYPSRAGRSLRATVGVAVGATYALVQLLMPMRFLAYGGNVLWHEQGMRFSWRVMVREKNGSVTFLVRSVITGRVWEVSPAKYLTRHQEREMSGQPDLILQLAHQVHDDFVRQGLGPVEVRAEAWASLNGRKMAPLIDPAIDLAVLNDGLGKAAFILPAPSGPPPAIRPVPL